MMDVDKWADEQKINPYYVMLGLIEKFQTDNDVKFWTYSISLLISLVICISYHSYDLVMTYLPEPLSGFGWFWSILIGFGGTALIFLLFLGFGWLVEELRKLFMEFVRYFSNIYLAQEGTDVSNVKVIKAKYVIQGIKIKFKKDHDFRFATYCWTIIFSLCLVYYSVLSSYTIWSKWWTIPLSVGFSFATFVGSFFIAILGYEMFLFFVNEIKEYNSLGFKRKYKTMVLLGQGKKKR